MNPFPGSPGSPLASPGLGLNILKASRTRKAAGDASPSTLAAGLEAGVGCEDHTLAVENHGLLTIIYKHKN